MIGVSGFLSALEKTQRRKESLVRAPSCPPPTDPDDSEPVATSSSPDQAPRTRPCATCNRVSGTVNEAQEMYIRKRWDELKHAPDLPTVIQPPKINLQKPPRLADYLLKPTVVFHPERQYHFSLSDSPCPLCHASGGIRFKEMSRPRQIHSMHSDLYFIR